MIKLFLYCFQDAVTKLCELESLGRLEVAVRNAVSLVLPNSVSGLKISGVQKTHFNLVTDFL